MAIEILYIGNGCLGKHQFLSGCLGFQVLVYIQHPAQLRSKSLQKLLAFRALLGAGLLRSQTRRSGRGVPRRTGRPGGEEPPVQIFTSEERS